MLSSLCINNLTVFSQAQLNFSRRINVFVGENGAGKTHLLKLAYAVSATLWEGRKIYGDASPTKSYLQTRLAEKLIGVFRPEKLGRLARRKQGRERCEILMQWDDQSSQLEFNFATNTSSEVNITIQPKKWLEESPVYIPTRELLTIYPSFVSIYDTVHLEFEETWRDLCILLGAPLRKGPREAQAKALLAPLEQAMRGSIELDANGRFYLKTTSGRMEMPLVAEGLRKLGMLSRLIATGALLDKGYLFWDEPETNLNPNMLKTLAATLIALSARGVQIFIATHSLFLIRELSIQTHNADVLYFGLHPQSDGAVSIQGGRSIGDIGVIAALEAELQQSDDYLDAMKG